MGERMGIIFFVLLLGQVTEASLVSRTNLGLFGGQIEGLATFDLAGTPNRVYADVKGANALYFTDSSGLNWTLAITGQDTRGVVTDANYVYIGVNSNEIWRSAGNDGLVWISILHPGMPVYLGEPIFSVQHDGARLMVGCATGVAYFNPTGNPADWTRHVISPSGPEVGPFSIASRPSNPNTIMAVFNDRRQPTPAANQLFVSIDGGATWAPVSLPAIITSAIEQVAEDPNNLGYVYLAGDSANSRIYENKLFLDPAGWTDISPTVMRMGYPQYIQFHNNLLWSASQRYDVTSGTWNPLPMTITGTHINDGAIAFDPDDPNIVLVSSDVGVSVSLDGAATFIEQNTGIAGVEVFDVDVDDFTKDVALVSSKSGLAITTVFQKPPTPADWTFPVFPQGAGGAPLTAVSILTDSTQEFLVGDNSETIYLSEDQGATWRVVYKWLGSPMPDRSSVTDIDHTVGSNTVYASLGFWEFGNNGVIARSNDRGKTWTECTLGEVYPNAIEVLGTNLIYAGCGHYRNIPSATNIGIYASNDGGLTWIQVIIPAFGAPILGVVMDLAQHPTNPAIQFAAVMLGPNSGAVFQIEYDASGLNVVNFTDLTMAYGGPFQGQFNSIETDPTGSQVYVGISENVFQFDIPSTTWSLYHTGIQGENVYSLYWDDLVSGTSTGFYRYDPVPASVQDWMVQE